MEPVSIIMGAASLVSAASTAFEHVKKAIAVGKEVHEVATELGGFFEAISKFKDGQREAENPPVFKKILHSQSVEREALEYVIHQQRVFQMEKELRELIWYAYGDHVYNDMMDQRKKIQAARERAVHLQEQRKKALLMNTVYTIVLILMLAACYAAFSVIWSV